MRPAIVCLAALALATCGQARGTRETNTVPTLDVRSPRHVRLYIGEMPRCGFREVATVSGRNYRELQDRAFQLRANAVILETGAENRGAPYTASAVQFTRADCQQ
ncbi:MAG TPA: hypothetical protein VHG08_06470 [Longimicrobium sp.]|nr:hypothetical protein [Longimicrobium sp.]